MKKKIVYLLLAVMTAGALAGCGSKEPAAETSQAVESTVESSSAATESSETVTVQEDHSKEVYEAFLQGTEKLYTDNYEGTRYDSEGNEVIYYPENGGYNLDEFLKATLEIESDVCYEQYIQQVGYQFIDCGADGVPELLLFVGVQTDEYYYSERQYVCKAVDGKLQLTYQTESNYYAQEAVTSDTGAVASYAMYSYNYWYESHGYLNAEGQYHQVSNVLVSMDSPASYILDARFTEAINDDFGAYDEVYVRAYGIGEVISEDDYDTVAETYYCGEKEEDEASNGIDFKANMELLQKAFDKTGVKLYTMAEIQSLIADRVKAIGAEAAEKNGKVLDYTFLDLKDAWTEVVYGEYSDGGWDMDEDTISLTIYSPGEQIWVDGDTIYFYSEIEYSEFTEVYRMDGDTTFYDDEVTAFFEGYQAGDTPMEWVLRMLDEQEEYPTALTGVFAFTVDGSHIDSLNGSYWWD